MSDFWLLVIVILCLSGPILQAAAWFWMKFECWYIRRFVTKE